MPLAWHPGAVEVRRRTHSLVTRWRLYYGMPPNDPRVLAITEDEAGLDLLVLDALGLLKSVEDEEAMEGLRAMMDPKVLEALKTWREEVARDEQAAEELERVRAALPRTPRRIRAKRSTGGS